MAYELDVLTAPANNYGGVAWLAVALTKDRTAEGARATLTALGDGIRVTGDDTYTAGKEPIKLPILQEGFEMKTEPVGEGSGKRWKTTVTAMVYGSSVETMDFMRLLSVEPGVSYLKTASCDENQIFRVGCCAPAEYTCNFNTGKIKDGVAMWTLEVVSYCFPDQYEGTLTFRA